MAKAGWLGLLVNVHLAKSIETTLSNIVYSFKFPTHPDSHHELGSRSQAFMGVELEVSSCPPLEDAAIIC